MMYLKVKFIRNTDHPHGRKTLEGYIAAENKTVAKVKAAEYLYGPFPSEMHEECSVN